MFTIEWMEKKTTAKGKEKYNATLKAENGELVENVTLWADYPGFSTLLPGSTVYGDIVPAIDQRYGPTLYPPKPERPANRSFGASRGSIAAAQATRRDDIKLAQENREQGVKLASTYRMAVDVVVARGITDMGQDLLEEEIKNWRKYFWETWDEPVDKEWPIVK